ncbi:MAG: hypothetical protein KatS3mg126_1237 [Lysobacteraceae bacterium]|nr:MAG: hypothetical protein KatS3mg126_1237 [Xanthomonadaceae bacterium]
MIQGIVTAVLIVLFLAGSAWVFSSKRKPAMDAAARLALDEDPTEARAKNPHAKV